MDKGKTTMPECVSMSNGARKGKKRRQVEYVEDDALSQDSIPPGKLVEFKIADKHIKFNDFHGEMHVDKALAFISLFEVAFMEEEDYTDKSKL